MANSSEATTTTTTTAEPQSWSLPYRWVVLVLVFGTQMFCASCIAGLSPILPFLTEDLGMSMAQTGTLFTAINLGTCIMAFFTGKIIVGCLPGRSLHALWQALHRRFAS